MHGRNEAEGGERIIRKGGEGGKENRQGNPRKRKEEEMGVGNKTKRLFGFSRILRFSVCSAPTSDSSYITEKGRLDI